MTKKIKDVLLVLLAAIAIAMFVAAGGDGDEPQTHARWMNQAKEGGAWVMW